jgi:hypothetical protein
MRRNKFWTWWTFQILTEKFVSQQLLDCQITFDFLKTKQQNLLTHASPAERPLTVAAILFGISCTNRIMMII